MFVIALKAPLNASTKKTGITTTGTIAAGMRIMLSTPR